ncbi:MAG: hypothetical protein HOW73_19355 [Polyangiaceae bacterium]|nr:hypothetical protein [Polyangiaceae bacterium]
MSLWHHKPRAGQLPGGLITGVDQVCFVVRDLDKALDTMTRVLGVGPFKCFTLDEPALFDTTLDGRPARWSCRLAVTLVGRTQWEVVQPLDGATLQALHLQNRYEGAQHILISHSNHSFEEAQAKLVELGHPLAQRARVNLPMQVAGLTLSVPAAFAKSAATPFGYADTQDVLGTALEVARFPPGVAPPLATRLGKPDWWVPEESKNVTAKLEHSLFDRVTKLGFLSRDAIATMRAWTRFGVGPWITKEVGPADLTNASLGDFSARVGWCLLGDTLLEVIEPIRGATPHAELLRRAGPGLHIVGVKSDTLSQPQVLEQLRGADLPVVMQGVMHGGFEFAVVDARSAGAGWLEIPHLEAERLWGELRKLPGLEWVE